MDYLQFEMEAEAYETTISQICDFMHEHNYADFLNKSHSAGGPFSAHHLYFLLYTAVWYSLS